MNYKHLNKIIIVALSAIILVMTFVSCKTNTKVNLDVGEFMFAYDEQSVVEGGRDIDNLGLQSVTVLVNDDNLEELQITFEDNDGSEFSTSIRRKGIPQYSISRIDGADRMVIKIDGLDSVSYTDSQNSSIVSEVISGILLQETSVDGAVYLYISTLNDYTYNVLENKNKLIIQFSPKASIQTDGYYLAANKFYEYTLGEFNLVDFYPCICDDLTNSLMLNGPFDSAEDAQEYLDNNIGESLFTEEIDIININYNSLPKYSYDYKIDDIIDEPIGEKGTMHYADKLLCKGRFLSMNSNFSANLFAKYYVEEDDSGIRTYEQLWFCSESEKRQITDMQFESITFADYSYDSRYIALIDQKNENRMLYIIDSISGDVKEVQDLDYGSDISSIAWSEDGYCLYAIVGEGEIKHLICYEIKYKKIEAKSINDTVHMASMLYVRNGKIYYLNNDGAFVGIYALNIESGEEEFIVEGNSFKISDDGKMMIVNDMPTDDASMNSLFLYDLDSKELTKIVDNKMVVAYAFNSDSSGVYFTQDNVIDWEDEFPVALYYYNVDTKKLSYEMDMITGAIYHGIDSDEMILMSFFNIENNDIPVTLMFKTNE